VRATCSCVTTSTSLAFRGVPTVQRTLHRATAYSVSAATYSSVLRTTYYILRTDEPCLRPSAACSTLAWWPATHFSPHAYISHSINSVQAKVSHCIGWARVRFVLVAFSANLTEKACQQLHVTGHRVDTVLCLTRSTSGHGPWHGCSSWRWCFCSIARFSNQTSASGDAWGGPLHAMM
jgi:hypothetical protein